MILVRRFLRVCRKAAFESKIADSSGLQLTGGQLLTRALLLTRVLERLLNQDERHVGILLPPSVGAVIANVALTLGRRVPVNLNYSLSTSAIKSCIDQASIRHVLTDRMFLSKLHVTIDVDLIFLEDISAEVAWYDKLAAALAAYCIPVWYLERSLGLLQIQPNDLMGILFTSGTTGEPKGVMLSHDNIASNIDAANQLFQFSQTDAVLGIMPFFHSFGFTGGLWLALVLPLRGVYHFSPLDASLIGNLCKEQRVSIMLAAPTFLRLYLRRCHTEDFGALKLVVVGAEKMPRELADAFQQKFGVRPIEAYGTTELSPMAAINAPIAGTVDCPTGGAKEGTVGRAIPGTCARIVDPESNIVRVADEPGMLQIQGPNVMLGYLNRPEKTAEVIRDGWYVTGDIARMDRDGFITIVDRATRFSKIAGEMVPHLKVEECLNRVLMQDSYDSGSLQAVVTSIPDPKQGERLVALYRASPICIDEIITNMAERGLPNLWIPRRDSFVEVLEIPMLASGKVDLKRVKEIALEQCGG